MRPTKIIETIDQAQIKLHSEDFPQHSKNNIGHKTILA